MRAQEPAACDHPAVATGSDWNMCNHIIGAKETSFLLLLDQALADLCSAAAVELVVLR